MKIGEIFVALGFDVDDTKLKGFRDEVKDLQFDLLKIAGGAAAAVYAVNAFVESSIRSATALRNFNTQTDLSQNLLQKWQVAGHLSNIALTAESVTASIQTLQKNLTDIRMGKGNIQPFTQLGFGVDIFGKNAFEVLEEVRAALPAAIQRWGKTRVVNLLQEMGLDQNFINVLSLSKEKFDDLSDSLVLNDQAQEKLVSLGAHIAKFVIQWNFFKDNLVADWSPTLIKAIDATMPHIENIFRALQGIGEVIKEHPMLIGSLAVAFAFVLAPRLTLVAGALAGVVYWLDAMGRSLKGEHTIVDDFYDSVNNLYLLLQDLISLDFSKFKVDFQKIFNPNSGTETAESLQPSLWDNAMNNLGAWGQEAVNSMSNLFTFNNVFNIHSTADAQSVANESVNAMKHAYADGVLRNAEH